MQEPEIGVDYSSRILEDQLEQFLLYIVVSITQIIDTESLTSFEVLGKLIITSEWSGRFWSLLSLKKKLKL